MPAPHSFDQGTAALLGDVVTRVMRLLRADLALAKREMTQNAGRAGAGLLLIAGGAILGLVGLIALTAAGIAALVALGWSLSLAALAVGGGICLVAAVLLVIGLRSLAPERLLPRRAMANAARDVALLRERFDGRA
jgi:hypothetical protein